LARVIGFYTKNGKARPVTARTHRHGKVRTSTKRLKDFQGRRFSYADAKEHHEERRSAHAQVIDEALVAGEQYPPGMQDYSPWRSRVNRSDVRGIDVSPNVQIVRRPPPESRKYKPKKITAREAKKHPIVLRGREYLVDRYQPIVDKRFKDLHGANLTQRQIHIIEVRKPGIGGIYRYFLDSKGNPIPAEIAINPTLSKADQKDSVIHEGVHFRRNIHRGSKLGKFVRDKDREEKETVHETSARSGRQLIREGTGSYYSIHVSDPEHPEARLQDLKTLKLGSQEGTTNLERIEKNILARQGKTHLNKAQLARKPVFSDGRWHPPAENVDQYFSTSEREGVHVYSPDGRAKPEDVAKLVDQLDQVAGDETVYAWRDGKPYIILKPKKRES